MNTGTPTTESVAAIRASMSLDGSHLCPRDQTVTIREFGSGDLVEVPCCSDCRVMYADADLSEVSK